MSWMVLKVKILYRYLFLPRTVSWPIRAITSARHRLIDIYILPGILTQRSVSRKYMAGKTNKNTPNVSQILRKTDKFSRLIQTGKMLFLLWNSVMAVAWISCASIMPPIAKSII